MFKGIAFALASCLIWGTTFIVPQFMAGFSPVEVSIGRYLCYGIASCAIFLKTIWRGGVRYPFAVWEKAFYFSLASSFAYYPFLVLSLRYSSPAICALIIGISPIAIAFYGNWQEKECSFKSLIGPSLLILAGLGVLNIPPLLESPSPSSFCLGLLCAFLALASWSWYVVANSRFLKRNPQVRSSDWSTLIGVATLVLTVAFTLLLYSMGKLEIGKYANSSADWARFLAGSAALGLLCSWFGGVLWNRASFYLPVSLAGQLTIFETIFGLIYVYTLDLRLPPAMECVGIAILLAAIVYGIRQAAYMTPQAGSIGTKA